MTVLSAKASPLGGGGDVIFSPTKMELVASLSSPAQSLTVTGVYSGAVSPLKDVALTIDGQQCFCGNIDRQELEYSPAGKLLNLEARSQGALLLDNEACPVTLYGANLTVLFNRLIKPYGFVCYNPNPTNSVGVYSIYKGQSEWEAFCGFCRRLHGITPYVTETQVMVDIPRKAPALIISNTGKGIPFSELRQEFIPYEMISDIYLRDNTGKYSTRVENPDKQAYGVSRKRYVIPPGDMPGSAGADAYRRMHKSMREANRVSATLPGFVSTQPGQLVEIDDRQLQIANLRVEQCRYLADSRGFRTQLELGSTLYL